MQRLIAHHAIADGTPLTIVVPDLVDQDRDAIRAWLDEDPHRARVSWRNDVNGPVEWAVDGQHYRLIQLIRLIIDTATGQPPRAQLWAQNWYRTEDGQTLHQLARVAGYETARNWVIGAGSDVHQSGGVVDASDEALLYGGPGLLAAAWVARNEDSPKARG